MRRMFTSAVLAGILAAMAAPVFAQDHDRHRGRSRSEEQRADGAQPAPRAVNRADRAESAPPPAARRAERVQPAPAPPSVERRAERVQPAPPSVTRRAERVEPAPPVVVNRAVPRAVPPAAAYGHDYERRGYDRRYDGYYDHGHVVIVPRVVRPVIVSVVPYRPYVYRPTYRVYPYAGPYYDPYAYPVAPYGYYNPIPGRPYGGLRITGVPRDAQVFADGYYVGVVNDFDGIFQHLNLEAGPHHIEIREPGFQPIAFDVIVRPGETITYRADGYGY